ncbi:hypothetical protein F0L68_08815 [Solihabitans fulvus]|uniref:Uncharacterized protein n=1 Tax=Solihabitans fulvus TaxID=1892852 RepID=A0A5B2XLT1_9PSEU|nr:hypothetical protein [Solihabitans fulvus]KAA2264075.1 hypothetical protein F0L68_08815 [Solihabitans fulvus]
MYRSSPVEITTQANISENFDLHYVASAEGEVELRFSGGTELLLSFSQRGFQHFKAQWPNIVAKHEAALTRAED